MKYSLLAGLVLVLAFGQGTRIIGEASMKYLLLLSLALSAFAQNANVIALIPADASKAKLLNDNVEKAKDALNVFNEEVKKKYLIVPGNTDPTSSCSAGRSGLGITAEQWITTKTPCDKVFKGPDAAKEKVDACEKWKDEQASYDKAHPALAYRGGWGCGIFQYSTDFKFIVPIDVNIIGRAPQSWITN